MRFPYTLTPLFCAWGGILLFDHLFVCHFVSLIFSFILLVSRRIFTGDEGIGLLEFYRIPGQGRECRNAL